MEEEGKGVQELTPVQVPATGEGMPRMDGLDTTPRVTSTRGVLGPPCLSTRQCKAREAENTQLKTRGR
eukprot:2212409-Lingulodinium_polyedra.AAC.1